MQKTMIEIEWHVKSYSICDDTKYLSINLILIIADLKNI